MFINNIVKSINFIQKFELKGDDEMSKNERILELNDLLAKNRDLETTKLLVIKYKEMINYLEMLCKITKHSKKLEFNKKDLYWYKQSFEVIQNSYSV